jgi:hypothetical protein
LRFGRDGFAITVGANPRCTRVAGPVTPAEWDTPLRPGGWRTTTRRGPVAGTARFTPGSIVHVLRTRTDCGKLSGLTAPHGAVSALTQIADPSGATRTRSAQVHCRPQVGGYAWSAGGLLQCGHLERAEAAADGCRGHRCCVEVALGELAADGTDLVFGNFVMLYSLVSGWDVAALVVLVVTYTLFVGCSSRTSEAQRACPVTAG